VIEKKELAKITNEWWKVACLKQWGNRCCVCGREATTVHHFFPKGCYKNLKYEIENGVPICNDCHKRHHSNGDKEIHKKIVEKRGEVWYNKLKSKKNKKRSSYLSRKFYEDKIKEFKLIN